MQALVAAPAAAAFGGLPLRPRLSRTRAAPVLGSSRRSPKQTAQQPCSSALRSLSPARSLYAGGALLRQRQSRRSVAAASAPRAGAGKPARNDYNGVFLLILINVVLYVAVRRSSADRAATTALADTTRRGGRAGPCDARAGRVSAAVPAPRFA